MKKLLLMLTVLCGTVSAWAQTAIDAGGSVSIDWTTETWTTVDNVPDGIIDADLISGLTKAEVVGKTESVNLKAGHLHTTFKYKSGNNRLEMVGVDLLDAEGNVVDSDYHFGYTGNYQQNPVYTVYVPTDGTYTLRGFVSFKKEANTSSGTITVKHVDSKIEHKKWYKLNCADFPAKYIQINDYDKSSTGPKGTVILSNKAVNADQIFTFIPTEESNKYKLKSLSGYYLKITYWNYDANKSNATVFTIEGADVDGYTISQSDFTTGGDMTNAQTIDGVEYLFCNAPDAEADKWFLTEVDLDAMPEVDVKYEFTYNGEVKFTQDAKAKACATYPDITVEIPYGVSATKPSGYVTSADAVDGVITKTIEMTTDLPFLAQESNASITNWYYTKMHSNNQKYIQYLDGEEYIEWADATMDVANLDSYTWAFVGNPFDGFKLVNKAAGIDKALQSSGSGNPKMVDFASATSFVYAKSQVSVPAFCMKYPGGNYLNAQSGKIAHWSANDAGSTFLVEDAIPVQLTTDDANPICYAIRSGRGATSWYSYDSSDSKIALTANDGSDTFYWYFKAIYVDSKLCVQLFPKTGGGKAMSYSSTKSDGAGLVVAQELSAEGYYNTWNFVNTNGTAPYGLKTYDGVTYLSNWGGTKNKMGFYNSGPTSDKGTAMYIYEVMEYSITDMAENTFTGNKLVEIASLDEPTFTGCDTYSLTDKVWDGNKFSATINFGVPVSKADGVTNWKMMANGGGGTGAWTSTPKYWHAVLEDGTYNVKVQTAAPTVDGLSTWMWAIYPHFDNDAFTFTIKNMASGNFAYADPSKASNPSGEKGFVTLAAEGTKFTITKNGAYPNFTYKNSSDATLDLSNNGGADTDVYLGAYSGNHPGNNIYFPNATASLTVGEAGYASLYLPFSVSVPAGLEAYAIEVTSANYAALESKTDIPANEGAILKGTGTFTLTETTATSDWSGNLLEGSNVDTYVQGSAYVLGKVNDVVGLYKAKLNKDEAGAAGTTHFLNNANKAYLPASVVPAGARFLMFDFGTETGIENIEGAENANGAAIYDLSGRRVQKAQKGLYIINGKKVVK